MVRRDQDPAPHPSGDVHELAGATGPAPQRFEWRAAAHPDHHPAARAEDPEHVLQGLQWLVQVHEREERRDHVEGLGLVREGLGVALLVLHLALQALLGRDRPGLSEHALGEIDADHAPAGALLRRQVGDDPTPGADVQDVVGGFGLGDEQDASREGKDEVAERRHAAGDVVVPGGLLGFESAPLHRRLPVPAALNDVIVSTFRLGWVRVGLV